MDDFVLRILLIAALVSLVVDMIVEEDKKTAWIEGAAILAAVFIVSLVTAWNDWKKQEQFLVLAKFNENSMMVTLKRDGKIISQAKSDILTGDLIQIFPGDNVFVDAILIEGNGVETDESAMTGETDEIKKETLEKCLENNDSFNHVSPILISGTNIMTGEGWMMALVVGEHS